MLLKCAILKTNKIISEITDSWYC